MGQIYAIFRNTLTETVRQPVYGLVLAGSCAIIALTPVTAAQIYSFRVTSGLDLVAERMIADLGLATVLLAGVILGIFTSTSVISREIENRTASTVLSKPVSRSAFVLGKYLGVAVSIVLATFTCSVMILLTIRAGVSTTARDMIDWGIVIAMVVAGVLAASFATLRNYYHHKPWVGSFNLSFIALTAVLFVLFSVIDKDYRFVFAPGSNQTPLGVAGKITYDGEVAKAALLTIQAVLVLASIAVAVSTRLGTLGNAVVTATVFLFGLTSESLHNFLLSFQWGWPWRAFAATFHTVVPNLERFWVSDALTREIAIPAAYMTLTSGYALSYVLAMLFVAAFLMETRDLP